MEAYLDNLVDDHHVHVVGSPGNHNDDDGDIHCGQVGYEYEVAAPGGGHNLLTVGGLRDNGDENWANDSIWYDGPQGNSSPGFCWKGPLWNDTVGLQDRVKPEITAPAVDVAVGPFAIADGTSIAVPQVAATMGILLGQNRAELAGWPQKTRAILIASSYLHQTPGGTLDLEGYGSLHTLMATRIVDRTYGDFGVKTITEQVDGACPEAGMYRSLLQSVTINDPGTVRLRFAISWHSHGSYTGTGPTSATYSDALFNNFNLTLRDLTTGTIVASGGNSSSANEIADVWQTVDGHNYRVDIRSVCDFTNVTEKVGWAYVTYPNP